MKSHVSAVDVEDAFCALLWDCDFYALGTSPVTSYSGAKNSADVMLQNHNVSASISFAPHTSIPVSYTHLTLPTKA